MNQLSIFEMPSNGFEDYVSDADPLLVKKFLEYHDKNPDLYRYFKRFAFEALKSGRRRFSIWMLANRIRWYCQIETTGAKFKVSNDYLALYARLLVYEYPEFDGMFQFKQMKKNRKPPIE